MPDYDAMMTIYARQQQKKRTTVKVKVWDILLVHTLAVLLIIWIVVRFVLGIRIVIIN